VAKRKSPANHFFHISSPHRAPNLGGKAREARSHGADIFKVATPHDTPMELGRLLEFMTQSR
jgi:hypothetical protein